jgi:glutamine synthetase type III
VLIVDGRRRWNGPGGEAEQRGLRNLKTSPEAYDLLMDDKNVKMFEELKVFSYEEVLARQEIMYEQYVGTVRCRSPPFFTHSAQ